MKKKSPKSKTAVAVVYNTEESMLGGLNRYIELSLDLAARKAAHEKVIAEMQTDFDDQVQPMREEMALLETSVELFCNNYRESLFAEKKSREYANAVIGFRDDPPSVGKMVAKDTFEAIAARMLETSWGEPFVTFPDPELNKKELLIHRADLTEQQLREVGLTFKQGEKFYVDPKAESVERVAKPVEVAA